MTAAAQTDVDPRFAGRLVDSLSAGLIALGPDDRVAFVNPTAESLLKTSRGQVVGKHVGDLFDASAPLVELCRRCRQDHATYIQREFRASPSAHPDEVVVVDIAASPFDGDGIVLETRDARLPSQVDKENVLLAQHDVGRAIVRQLAHEIKNPLGGLRGAAQLLAKKLATPGMTAYTDVIIREADRLVTLVDTMLGPSGPLEKEQVNIHRALDHVWRLMAGEAPQGVTIERDYDPSLPKIELDEDRLIQALLNLGRNALQAVGDNGDITLRTRVITGFAIRELRYALVLRIDFEDSGPGVDEHLKDKLFYPLVTGRQNGMGLGLAVAQDLINRHGGLIRLIPAERTVFSIFLPLRNASWRAQ